MSAVTSNRVVLNGVDLSHHVVAFDLKAEYEEPELSGYKVARAGGSIAECPFAPSDPEGLKWRQDWIRGEQFNRMQAGTFDHTPDEYSAYRESIGWSDAQLHDPAAEILGEPQPFATKPPSTSVPFKSYGLTVPAGNYHLSLHFDTTPLVNAMKEATERINAVFALTPLDIDKLASSLQGLVEPDRETPRQRARRREIQLLADRRRSHRRSNRWGSRPGR